MEPAGGSLPLVQAAFYWGSCLQLAWLTLAPADVHPGAEKGAGEAEPESSSKQEPWDAPRWACEVGREPGDSHSRPGGHVQGRAPPSPDYGNKRIQVMTLAHRWDAGTPRDQRADPCLASASSAVPLKSWAGQPGHLSCTCCWATRSPLPGHPAIVTTGK